MGALTQVNARRERVRWAVAAGVGILMLGYLVAVPLGLVDKRLTTAEIVLAAALLVGVVLFDKVTDFTVGAAGVRFKLRTLEQRQSELETEIDRWRDRVTRLFLNAMAETKRTNLEKVRDGGYYKRNEDFLRELTGLRDDGYLGDFDRSTIPEHGTALGEYIPITAQGREFLELRAMLVSESPRTQRLANDQRI